VDKKKTSGLDNAACQPGLIGARRHVQ